jgi:putative spermidine/putrescine transport system permease protein
LLPSYAGLLETIWYYAYRIFCGLVLLFLIMPVLVIIPLSFNAEPYFSFTSGMLSLDPEAYSFRWYADIINNKQWMHSAKNSLIIAFFATVIATSLGTIAALGLSRPEMPYRGVIMGLLISPMIVPLIISAAGMYFFYSSVGLTQSYIGIILAHAALGTPFVVITVTATLTGFDQSLIRAANNLGASGSYTFFNVTMPLILPGMISGGLFAFITSFDEVVAVLFLSGFEQRTIPRQMWAGIREQISPTILAVATILVFLSIALLVTIELLRRRSDRLRGVA